MISPAAFATALAAATPGAVLELGAGNYGKLSISKRQGLTFKSDGGAIFDTINVASSSDIRFDGIVVEMAFVDGVTKHNIPAVRFSVCDKVSFNNGRIKGPLATTGAQPTATAPDASGNVIGYPSGTGITFDRCTNSEALGNDISQLERGISFNGVIGLKIDLNDLHDLRKDPISGQAISGLEIGANHCWHMSAWAWGQSYGDHGDFMHVWTLATQSGHTTGVAITDNLLEQAGGTPVLGPYLDTNNSTGGNPNGFQQSVLRGNILINDNGQGFRLEDTENSQVSENILLATSAAVDWKAQPRIGFVGRAAGNAVVANRAADITGLTTTGNTLGLTKDGEADAAKAAWLAKFRPQPVAMSRDPFAILTDMEALCAELRTAL